MKECLLVVLVELRCCLQCLLQELKMTGVGDPYFLLSRVVFKIRKWWHWLDLQLNAIFKFFHFSENFALTWTQKLGEPSLDQRFLCS